MSERFSIGEIAILHNCVHRPYRNGIEVEIIGPLEPRRGRCADGSFVIKPCYRLRDSSGFLSLAEPQNLRKKKPPREDLTVISWDSVPWWPEELVRNVKETSGV